MAAAGPSKRAWDVQWRNFQARKNKTWEKDGVMLVEGLGVTVYAADGKLIGARNLTMPVSAEMEFSLSGKDVMVTDQTTLEAYYLVARSKGGLHAAHSASTATPSKPVPGYLSRGAAPALTDARSTTPSHGRQTASGPARTETPVDPASSNETPSMATTSWVQPHQKFQKPFKSPAMRPVAHDGGSPAARLGTASRAAVAGPSKLRERLVPEPQAESPKRAAIGSKGKGRAIESEDDEEMENSPPLAQPDGPPSHKKLRVELPKAAESPGPARLARRSAADAAFERAISRNNSVNSTGSKDSVRAPPLRTRSTPDRPGSTREANQPLFRRSESLSKRSPSSGALRVGQTSAGDEVLEGSGLCDDMELDAKIFDDDWGEESEEEKPQVSKQAAAFEEAAEIAASTLSESADRSSQPEKRKYSCNWRKKTTAKTANWAGDATLMLTGRQARLIDDESGKVLAQGGLPANVEVEADAQFTYCGITLQVLAEETGFKSSATVTLLAPEPNCPPVRPVQATSGTAFRPPAPAKATNPLARRVAARSASPAVEPAPPRREAARQSLPPAPTTNDSFKLPRLFDGSADSPAAARRRTGPLFDPTTEGALVMPRPTTAHQQEYNKHNAPIVDVVVDPKIADKLRAHQREGVTFLYECVMGMRSSGQGCILADDMGLGKTIQAITLVWTLLKQSPYQAGQNGEIKRAMIVCPATLVKNWKAEFRKWIGKDRIKVLAAEDKQHIHTFVYSKNYDVLIVGYEKVRDCVDELKAAQPPIGLVICDEGHRLKSEKTKTSQALQSLSCMRRVILSGTPIQNNLGEFFAMMDYVNPGILQDAAYFKKNFEVPIMAARQPDSSSKARKEGEEALETLMSIQNHFLLRRTNEVILEHLPPKHEYTVFVRPTVLQIDVYRTALSTSAIRTVLEGRDMKHGLALLQNLLKLATSPGLLWQQIKEKGVGDLDESVTNAFPADIDAADFALSSKLHVLGLMLKTLFTDGEEKIIVVSNFTTTLDLIEKHCKRHKYPYCRLDGKTPQQDRIAIVDKFNKGPRNHNFVFLLSSKSGGTGLNIIGASRLVQVDSDWNPSNDLQAMARIHREGQPRPCFIYRLLTSGTVDEVVYQRQLTKLALSGSIMSGDGGSSSKNKNAFTADELRNLFTLHDEVACQTHDLLGCRCHIGEPMPEDDDNDAGDASNSESSSEDEFASGFVQASQYQDQDAKRSLARSRRHLSVLKTWTHASARNVEHIEKLQDGLLKALIYEKLGEADETSISLPSETPDDLDLCHGQIAFVFEKKTAAP
ncbi:DNA repair and recombination protein RAD54 [Rhodotorula taiwanensis]|uniref:DNA repair and recombination protein RAD54 n=1 Tax=Rhodotorula taiwanensis TaxID=741276 RepID=A0A2S5BHJ0_9BASI|nr:DNA repair and recombination protein RAD54 [Rhodotorula taiwanensis]